MTDDRVNILLIDDDPVFAKVFGRELGTMGFQVHQGYGEDIPAIFEQNHIDIAILDIVMPDVSGLELLKTIRARWSDVDVIMLTGNSTVENALSSMKSGAFDYVTKPVELQRVEQILRNCMEQRRLKHENLALKNKLSDLQDSEMIGDAPSIREVKSLISRFADSDSTVLISGESGTGKELVAHLIHKNSLRRHEPFIIVDCTALKENLLESELFGHERGAFTDAIAKKHGIFEITDGGSVFLDEIGDLSPSLQVKLLRVVDTKSFRRLGGTKRIHVDVRLIAATNRDLVEMVRQGQFREDLYYRLNVVSISLPPLREHKEDIPLLVNHLLEDLRKSDRGPKRFSEQAMQTLMRHDWPGNVRELSNLVERCLVFAEADVIDVDDLPLSISPLDYLLTSYEHGHFPSLDEIENAYIKRVLEATGGNKQLAAKILRIDRKTILRRLNKGHTAE